MTTITQEQLNSWYEHKSNKEAFIERQEATEEEEYLDSDDHFINCTPDNPCGICAVNKD